MAEAVCTDVSCVFLSRTNYNLGDCAGGIHECHCGRGSDADMSGARDWAVLACDGTLFEWRGSGFGQSGKNEKADLPIRHSGTGAKPGGFSRAPVMLALKEIVT